MRKETKFAFECKHFRIAYQKTVSKPDKKRIEAKEPKLIEERRIDTYA